MNVYLSDKRTWLSVAQYISQSQKNPAGVNSVSGSLFPIIYHIRELRTFVIFSVDGGWTPWSVWSDCSVTCGRGNQIRTRACINPPPRNNGTHCPGADREMQHCHIAPCLGNKVFFTCVVLNSGLLINSRPPIPESLLGNTQKV